MSKAAATNTILDDAPTLAELSQGIQCSQSDFIMVSSARMNEIENELVRCSHAMEAVPFLISALMVESSEGRGKDYSYGIEILIKGAFEQFSKLQGDISQTVAAAQLRSKRLAVT